MNTFHYRISLISGAVLTLALLGCLAIAQQIEDEPGDSPPPPRDEQRPRAGGRGREAGPPPRPDRRGEFGRRDDRRGPQGHEPWRHLSDEQIEQRLEILREFNPEMARRIEHLMESRGGRPSDRIRKVLQRHWPHIEKLRNLKDHDPTAFRLYVEDEKLGRRCKRFAMQLRKSGGGTDEQKQELREMIAQHFDVRQRKMEHKLDKLEESIKHLKQQLELRREKRSDLEASRYNQLVGATSEAKW